MLNTTEVRIRLKQLDHALMNHPVRTDSLQERVDAMAARIDALEHDARKLINDIELMEDASW